MTQVSTNIQTQYAALQKQHQDFCNHLNLQLTSLQQQLAILLAQEQQCRFLSSLCVCVCVCVSVCVCVCVCVCVRSECCELVGLLLSHLEQFGCWVKLTGIIEVNRHHQPRKLLCCLM